MNRTALPLLLPLLLTACNSQPPEPYSSADLEAARALAAEGELGDAYNALEDLEREYFDRSSQGEYSLLAGDVAHQREDWDRAIHHYEEYLLFAGVARESERVERRLYEMGLDLLEGRRKAFGIFTDRSRGIVTLHNLAAWAPRGPYAPQALATTANYSYDEKEFGEASLDYRLLLENHPDSEFTDLANYRLGMCGFLQIDGPWVDARMIDHSAAQLGFYLQNHPSGLYRAEAEEALQQLNRFRDEREFELGDYYETIGNVRGARYHYMKARTSSFEDIAAEAESRIAALPEDPPMEQYQEDEDA